MAIIHNQVGSLRELLSKFSDLHISDFHSLEEVTSFRNGYQALRDAALKKASESLKADVSRLQLELEKVSKEYDDKISARELLLKGEQNEIDSQLSRPPEITHNSFRSLMAWYKRWRLIKRNSILKNHFEEEKLRPYQKLAQRIILLQRELDDKKQNPDRWIDIMSRDEVGRLELIKTTIDENKELYFGALGEDRAVKEPSKLPDSYVVINDYRQHFGSPIYDKKNNDRIYSVQIDHIVIGSTGIFLIETKNWSAESIESRDFFSPVKQLQRSSFAMFVVLNQAVQTTRLDSFEQRWGEQKISPKNIVLLMHAKPHQEFQFTKILTLPEVREHVAYGEKKFSEKQISQLTDLLTAQL